MNKVVYIKNNKVASSFSEIMNIFNTHVLCTGNNHAHVISWYKKFICEFYYDNFGIQLYNFWDANFPNSLEMCSTGIIKNETKFTMFMLHHSNIIEKISYD